MVKKEALGNLMNKKQPLLLVKIPTHQSRVLDHIFLFYSSFDTFCQEMLNLISCKFTTPILYQLNSAQLVTESSVYQPSLLL